MTDLKYGLWFRGNMYTEESAGWCRNDDDTVMIFDTLDDVVKWMLYQRRFDELVYEYYEARIYDGFIHPDFVHYADPDTL
jgi:TPP-dependent pyruvate/acetoin dehydrogenase alpha subunit